MLDCQVRMTIKLNLVMSESLILNEGFVHFLLSKHYFLHRLSERVDPRIADPIGQHWCYA